MLEDLIQLDEQLFVYLNSLGNTSWDGFWLSVTDKLFSIPFYLFAGFLLYRKIGINKTIYYILFIALLVLFSDQLAQSFKYGFKRLRPCHNEQLMGVMRLVKSYCGGKFSYFSAHASTGMALAFYFFLLLKPYYRYASLYLLLALFIGYSRIYIGVHFPLDVITGFVFGAIIAKGVYCVAMKYSNKVPSNLR